MNDAQSPQEKSLEPQISTPAPPESPAPESAEPASPESAAPAETPAPPEAEPASAAVSKPPAPAADQAAATSDAELEQEVAAALDGVNLAAMYGADGSDASAAMSAGAAPSKQMDGIVEGTVINVADDGVFVNLGGKSEGLLPKEELAEDETLQVGDKIKVAVVRMDQRDGILMLSKKTADQQLLRSNLKVGAMVEGRAIGHNKGGLELDIKGLRAFMPMSQIDLFRVDDVTPYLNQVFVCEVTEVQRGDKNIVVSRRKVLQKEQEEKMQETWDTLQEGQVITGKVRSLMDYGAFVDLGGIDGLLHVSELSWGRVDKPADVLSLGQTVEVRVIGIDREKQRIALSMKQACGDPWADVEGKYQVGSRYQAQIRNLADFGAFAELEPGVEGLIPISQMTWAGRIKHPSEVVQTGQMVEVEVLSVDLNKKRISLSIKQAQQNPWANVAERYNSEEAFTGTVARMTDFGAFITLEPGLDGLVHISELSDQHVQRVSDVLSEGQEVKVKVISIDEQKQRIGLSMKESVLSGQPAAQAEPMEDPYQYDPAHTTSSDYGQSDRSGKRSKHRPRRGGLDW